VGDKKSRVGLWKARGIPVGVPDPPWVLPGCRDGKECIVKSGGKKKGWEEVHPLTKKKETDTNGKVGLASRGPLVLYGICSP